MEFEPMTYKVYVKVDSSNRILSVNSSAFLEDVTDWILIDEGSEWPRFMHAQGNYFDKPIYTEDGVPQYKLDADNKPVERTEEEIAEDRIVHKTPAELREEAYNTEKIIEWNGEMITVTEAATLWMYYSSEGGASATELQRLISEAKTTIRDKYPDEET